MNMQTNMQATRQAATRQEQARTARQAKHLYTITEDYRQAAQRQTRKERKQNIMLAACLLLVFFILMPLMTRYI